jgi:hypothetical protein
MDIYTKIEIKVVLTDQPMLHMLECNAPGLIVALLTNVSAQLERRWCLLIFLFLSQVVGVDGIMSAYSSTLYSVALAGPTLFGPVVTKAAEIANHAVQYSNNKYFVLLIITVCNLTSSYCLC